jgi:hypothetical protein
MVEIWEYLLLGGTAYWVMTKARDYKDDSAKRALIGIGTGLIAAYKGPEVYKKFSNLNSTPEGKITKDRLTASAIAAAAGYMFGDKIMGAGKNQQKKLQAPEELE